jgi:molecular chaperone HscB
MEPDAKTSTKRTELHMARSMCWHCQSEMLGEYFCGQCVKVQPLSKELDYFTCLGLPRLLSIDEDQLASRFYELSRTFHPDFYHNKTEPEQAISLGNSALLNTAYGTLKDPIRRAEYLVRLESGAAKDIRSSPPAELFEEILALQEDREEYRALSAQQDPERKEQLRRKIEADRAALAQRQQGMEQRLFGLFSTWDALQSRADQDSPDVRQGKDKILKHMREILSHRTYLRHIVEDEAATEN